MDPQESRSRVVVFRLTESEYLLMKKACRETHRSMSDLARSLVLSALDPAAHGRTGLSDFQFMGEKLSMLSADVAALKGLVSQLSPERVRKTPSAGVHHSKERSQL